MEVLTVVLFLWWIPALAYEMIRAAILAKKELKELKERTGRK